MLYLNKKGAWEYENVGILIIVLISAVVLVFLMIYLFEGVKEEGSEFGCRQSIEAAARSKLLPTLGGAGRVGVKLDCPRDELVIKKSDVVISNKIDQDESHRIIADAMLTCWNKVGAGKVDPFSNWDNPKLTYCLICDTILFDEDLQKFVDASKDEKQLLEERSIKDIMPFLRSKIPSNKDKSYYELLYKTAPAIQPTESKPNARILPGSTILVQMHKFEAKDTTGMYVGYIGSGVILAAGVLGAVFTGGASIAAAAAATGIFVSASTIAAYDFYSTLSDSFSSCPKCNGIGGISILSSEDSFNGKLNITTKDGKTYEARMCDVIVN